MIKRLISYVLVLSIFITGCTNNKIIENKESTPNSNKENIDEFNYDINQQLAELDYANMSTPELEFFVTQQVYYQLLEEIDLEKYYIEDIQAVYVSKEYIEEIEFNTKENIFFGYSLNDVKEAFADTKYVFSVDELGETIVKKVEIVEDTTLATIIKNVAIGAGVILVSVTISALTVGGAPAISTIFAVSAKTATSYGIVGGISSGVVSAVATGIETNDWDDVVESFAVSASEGFKWGAITGAVTGAGKEFFALKGATQSGLTMNQVAVIQKESGYPLDVIKQFHSIEEYNVFKNANLKHMVIGGKSVLIPSNIDPNYVDKDGVSNLQRILKGGAAKDVNGNSYELHHIGQNKNGTLAILTKEQHDNAVLHGYKSISEIDRNLFAKEKIQIWKAIGALMQG